MIDFWLSHPWMLALASFVVALASTFLVRSTAVRLDFVSRPRGDRWNKRVVALGGGAGIFAGILLAVVAGPQIAYAVLLPCLAIFVVGFIDDLYGLPPAGKLFTQIVAAAWVVSHGYVLSTPWEILSMALTILWIVGVSNAVNLIDNMDGLAAGVTSIAALGMGLIFQQVAGSPELAALAFVVAGATGGFLFHNFKPAKVFMGDAGSLPLGFLLAVLATKLTPAAGTGQAYFCLVMAPLFLATPLFDTFLVMIARRSAKRPVMSGGRDHSSHRLVLLGLSESRAVLVLYGVTLAGVLAAWAVVAHHSAGWGALLIPGMVVVGLVLFGTFLFDLAVYPKESLEEPPASYPLTFRYFFELALDVCVISGVWTLAHLIRFGETGEAAYYLQASAIPRLPQLIVIKIAAFLLFKLYRGFWRSITVDDVLQIFKAVTLASLVYVVASSFKTRMQDLSRVVMIVDWLLTFMAILGTRTAISLFRRSLRRMAKGKGRIKTALVIPSDFTSLLGPNLKLSRAHELTGLIFTGPRSLGQDQVLGVIGGEGESSEKIDSILQEHGIEVLVVPENMKSGGFGLEGLLKRGVSIRKMRMSMD